MLIFANSFSEKKTIFEILIFWASLGDGKHQDGADVEQQTRVLAPTSASQLSPASFIQLLASTWASHGGPTHTAIFSEERGVLLLKTRCSGGLELFENSGQMQGALVEKKGGHWERDCQNIFSVSFSLPPLHYKVNYFLQKLP